jgi:hypothetical protein
LYPHPYPYSGFIGFPLGSFSFYRGEGKDFNIREGKEKRVDILIK